VHPGSLTFTHAARGQVTRKQAGRHDAHHGRSVGKRRRGIDDADGLTDVTSRARHQAGAAVGGHRHANRLASGWHTGQYRGAVSAALSAGGEITPGHDNVTGTAVPSPLRMR
jgi:hypothetical protein